MELAKYTTSNEIEIISIDSHMKKFINRYESKHTKRRYQAVLTQFAEFIMLEDIQSIGAIDYDVFISYQKHLSKTKSDTSVSNAFAVLRQFFNYLLQRGIIVRNECAIIKTKRTENKEAITALDFEDVVKLKMISKGSKSYDITNQIILVLGFNLGLRREEIARLKFGHIEKIDGGYVFNIEGKGSYKRVGALDDTTGDKLMNLISQYEIASGKTITERDYIVQSEADFSNTKKKKNEKPMDASNVYRRFKRMADKAGIEDVSPHTMRATLATTLYDRGYSVDKIQRVLGHKKIETTLHYIKRNNDVKNALELTAGY